MWGFTSSQDLQGKVDFSKFEGYPSSCPYFQGAAGIATPARYFEFQAAPRSLKTQMNYGIKIIKTEEQLHYGTYQKCLKVSLILIIRCLLLSSQSGAWKM